MAKKKINSELPTQELSKTRHELLSKFFYDLSKIIFTTMVVGQFLILRENLDDLYVRLTLVFGIILAILFAIIANSLLSESD